MIKTKFSKRAIIKLIVLLTIIFLILSVIIITSKKNNTESSSNSFITVNSPFIYYANTQSTKIIEPLKNIDGLDLPNQLIIEKGNYNFNGQQYLLDEEGLYRFVNPFGKNDQRVVYERDLNALISSLAWIVSHGNEHDGLSNIELSRQALNSKLYLTCGKFSLWAEEIINNLGYNARIVTSLTLDEWNDYDNGHTLLEVYHDDRNKWILYDLDNNFVFSQNDVLLSFMEFYNAVANDEYNMIEISNDTKLDTSGFIDKKTDYNYSFIAENYISSIRDWYKRVIQVPMIEKNDYYYHFNLENKDKIYNYSSSYKYMGKDEFMNEFYD